MAGKIYKKEIISIIDKAQVDFERCWSILEILKTDSNEASKQGELLASFQYLLAENIFKLDVMNSRLSSRIKITTDNKRLELYRDYRKNIRLISELGKSLGNAYVWIFYDNNRDLLKKHLAQERNPPFRDTSGYLTEINFIDAVKHIYGYLIIYHGITTILRLGDISIFCPKTHKIIGIAEIKSKPIVDNTCTAILHFILKTDSLDFAESINLNFNDVESHSCLPVLEKARNRLDRQIKKISDSMKQNEDNSIGKSDSEIHFNDLEKFFLSSKRFSEIGEAIVAAKFNFKHKKLSRFVFFKHGNINYDGLTGEVHKILDKEKKNNALFIKQCHISNEDKIISTPGIPPLFWYPINNKILKKIYFFRTGICTIYNTAILENKLSNVGFEKKTDGKFIKKIDDIIIEIPNLNYYHNLMHIPAQTCH